MTEKLLLRADYKTGLSQVNLNPDSDITHPEQIFSSLVIKRFGEGEETVQGILSRLDSDTPPTLEYYDPHGLLQQVPVLHAQMICSYEYPYRHDEIMVFVRLSPLQIRIMQPASYSFGFGY